MLMHGEGGTPFGAGVRTWERYWRPFAALSWCPWDGGCVDGSCSVVILLSICASGGVLIHPVLVCVCVFGGWGGRIPVSLLIRPNVKLIHLSHTGGPPYTHFESHTHKHAQTSHVNCCAGPHKCRFLLLLLWICREFPASTSP